MGIGEQRRGSLRSVGLATPSVLPVRCTIAWSGIWRWWSYTKQNGFLYLALVDDGGSYQFEPAARQPDN
jgi:hypothetical protein